MKWYDYLVACWFAFVLWVNIVIVFDPLGFLINAFLWVAYENIRKNMQEEQ